MLYSGCYEDGEAKIARVVKLCCTPWAGAGHRGRVIAGGLESLEIHSHLYGHLGSDECNKYAQGGYDMSPISDAGKTGQVPACARCRTPRAAGTVCIGR